MYKTLVIGCGNIGALYDIDNVEIQTHAKAFFINKLTSLTISDPNQDLVARIVDKYHCDSIVNVSKERLSDFDIVSICSPTDTHFKLLNDALDAGVKTIICEKPISNNEREMRLLEEKYQKNHSKILVNYIRRYQPSFIALKSYIQSIAVSDDLKNISVRYQRGFLNNCSHAMDLIEFLTGKELSLNKISVHNTVADHFETDPTLSLMASWNDTNVSVLGLSNILYSHFEIDLYFKNQKIVIRNAGKDIQVYKTEKDSTILLPLVLQKEMSSTDCLKNYMVPVTDYAIALTNNQNLQDNFISSVNLNLKMLKYKNN